MEKLLNVMLIILVFLLIGVSSTISIIYYNKTKDLKNNNSKLEEEINYYKELEKLNNEYEILLDNKSLLGSTKEELQEKLDNLEQEIEKLEVNNNYLRKEISKLS
jgi:peptidoglycan hydrolase CwlO-like protein